MSTNFKKKQKANLSQKIVFVFLGFLILFALVFLVVADVRTYQKKKELNAQIEGLKSKITQVQSSNDTLQQGIAQGNEAQYVEKVAREELDLQKPGETVVSFVASPTQTQNNNPPPKSFWQNWLAWLGGIFKK